MLTVIENVCLLTRERWPARSHVVLRDGVIRDILPAEQPVPDAETRLDARGGLAIPGLVNAHLHSNELYLRGSFYGVPLELYSLYNSARSVSGLGLEPDDLYNRTLVGCGEMLRNGITAVADDVTHSSLDREEIEAVLSAYRDSGMRARVSIAVQDSPWRRSLPYAGERPVRPDPVFDRVRNDPDASMRCYQALAKDWPAGGRVSLMVSASAPQRCSPELLGRLVHLARESGLLFHVHIQETLSQYVLGPKLFGGRSMVAFMSDQGWLGPETTIAHAIWVTDDDLRRIADAGAHVVHNPVSNLKLGSGIARVRDMLDAGINVTLGTDGLTCNDSLDMFEVCKTAALLSCVADTEFDRWLAPEEVLHMATLAGARANRFDRVGTLETGSRADVVILDPMSPGLFLHNNATAQTVFSARTRDVVHVLVDGKVLVRDGKCTTMDLAGTQDRVAAAAERFWTEGAPSIAESLALFPGVQRAYEEAVRSLGPSDVFRLVAPPAFEGAALGDRPGGSAPSHPSLRLRCGS